MADAAPYAIAALLCVAVWIAGLLLIGILTPADVRAWKRITALRGYSPAGTHSERIAKRVPVMQLLLQQLDLLRLLGTAGRVDSAVSFVSRSMAAGLGVFALTLILDALGRTAVGDWPAAPWLTPLCGLLILPLRLAQLRHGARDAQRAIEQSLGDMMMPTAVMTDARGFQIGEAVRTLSRCMVDERLRNLIDREEWRTLVKSSPRSTIELYRLLGAAFEIPLFLELADSAATTNVGFPEREAYTRLAVAFYRGRLADARIRAARARVLVTLPVAAMLIPLLLLIGAPTFQAVTRGLQGG